MFSALDGLVVQFWGYIIYMSVSDDPKNENIKCFCFN